MTSPKTSNTRKQVKQDSVDTSEEGSGTGISSKSADSTSNVPKLENQADSVDEGMKPNKIGDDDDMDDSESSESDDDDVVTGLTEEEEKERQREKNDKVRGLSNSCSL